MTATEMDPAAIFARVWDGTAGALTPALARHVLTLGFADADTARMRELVARNRDGRLTDQELEILDNYVLVGDLLAVLQAKARRLLKAAPAAPAAPNDHG
jgi:hypothetical protein